MMFPPGMPMRTMPTPYNFMHKKEKAIYDACKALTDDLHPTSPTEEAIYNKAMELHRLLIDTALERAGIKATRTKKPRKGKK